MDLSFYNMYIDELKKWGLTPEQKLEGNRHLEKYSEEMI